MISRNELYATQAARMAEKTLQAGGDRIAQDLGYMTYHTWRSIHSTGGFPDSVYLRGDRGIVVEYKRQSVKDIAIPLAQISWLAGFEEAGFESYVWRPLDLLNGTIFETLNARQKAGVEL